jgi:hypothetical protein
MIHYVTSVSIPWDPMIFGIARDDTPDDLGALIQEQYRDALITWAEEMGPNVLITCANTSYATCERFHEEFDDQAMTPDDCYAIIAVAVADD